MTSSAPNAVNGEGCAPQSGSHEQGHHAGEKQGHSEPLGSSGRSGQGTQGDRSCLQPEGQSLGSGLTQEWALT